MLRSVSFLLVALFGCSACFADNVGMTFASLAPEAGQTITSYTQDGWTLAGEFVVVGPAAPAWTGIYALAPETDSWTLTTNIAATFSTTSLFLSFGKISPGITNYDFTASGSLGGLTDWSTEKTGSMANSVQLTYHTTPQNIDTVELTNNGGIEVPYQLFSVALSYTPNIVPSVPEPSSLALMSVGIGFLAARCRKSRRIDG